MNNDLAHVGRPPFKADVVGSLLRPPRIHAARARRAAGEISDGELWQIECDAVAEAVALQKTAGLRVCTDGEFHRRHWFMDFVERISGIRFSGRLKTKFHTDDGDIEFSPPRLEIHAALKRECNLVAEHFESFKPIADTAGLMPKQAIPSPTLVHFRSGGRAGIDKSVYPDFEQFIADLTRVYREEIASLYSSGCRYLQIDETNLPSYLCDPKLRDHAVAMGESADGLPLLYARLLNDVLRGRPRDLTVCMHMCRGNHAGAWFAEGGYDAVAEIAFGQINVDAFFLEYDSPRAGTFEPLRYLSDGKVAVLGLVTTKKPQLESKDELKRRIDDAGKVVPLGRLALSPQCGFASTIEGNPLTIDDEKRKLALVVETAREVWGVT